MDSINNQKRVPIGTPCNSEWSLQRDFELKCLSLTKIPWDVFWPFRGVLVMEVSSHSLLVFLVNRWHLTLNLLHTLFCRCLHSMLLLLLQWLVLGKKLPNHPAQEVCLLLLVLLLSSLLLEKKKKKDWMLWPTGFASRRQEPNVP